MKDGKDGFRTDSDGVEVWTPGQAIKDMGTDVIVGSSGLITRVGDDESIAEVMEKNRED